MTHDLYDREDGLAHCKVCGGAEGSLPAHCPGVRMTHEQEQAVMEGCLSYHGGAWRTRYFYHHPDHRALALERGIPEAILRADQYMAKFNDQREVVVGWWMDDDVFELKFPKPKNLLEKAEWA